LEEKAGVNQPDRVRVWSDEVEANIDRIMVRSDYKDFTIGLWEVVTDKDGSVEPISHEPITITNFLVNKNLERS
jgi:hypothetical protein